MRQLMFVFVCGAAALAGCGKGAAKAPPPPPPRPVEVLAVAPAELRSTGEYLGSLLSRGSVIVLPQVAGYVRAIHVAPGQKVAANDPIVEIDAREENAALSSASAEAESAKARLGLAQQQLTRAEALYKEGLATAQEIDQRRADVAAATAAVRAAGAQVSQRQVALSYRAIRAPIPGEVGDVTVRLGDYVTPTTPVTTIAKAATLELSVSVPASRARTLHLGAPLEVLADDGSVAVASAVTFIAPEVDPKTQLVEVKATFDNTVGLRPNELVRARVIYRTSEAMTLPVLAVQRQSGQSFAFAVVERDGQMVVERRPVKLGEIGEGGYRIESGLAAGDRVAVTSLQMLRDGQPIVIQAAADKAKEPDAPTSSPPQSGKAAR